MKFPMRYFIFVVWLLPLAGILQFIPDGFDIQWAEFFWVLKNTIIQAVGSTFFTLSLGFIGSLGLLWLSSVRYFKTLVFIEILLIVPSFLPSLFIILASLQMIDPFPMGRIGIIFVHGMMNFGIISVIMSQLMIKKISGFSETAATLGIKFWQFLFKVVLPILREDLMRLSFFIFSICFISFTVPITVGGGRGTTIEVLIYEKIRSGESWSQALTLSLIQLLFLFLISLTMKRFIGLKSSSTNTVVQILPKSFGLYFILFISLWLYGSFVIGFFQGLSQINDLLEMKEVIFQAILNTYILSVSGGLILAASYLYIGFLWPDRWLEKILNGIVAPSTVLIGFGIILLFQKLDFKHEWFRLQFGLWVLFFPTLLRWLGLSVLKGLESQILSAEVLGAKRVQIFNKIIFPQILKTATWVGGVGAFWISGEFALSRIIMNQDKTLGLIAQSFISSYRLSLGTVICGLMIFCGLLSFLTIRGFEYVFDQKFKS